MKRYLFGVAALLFAIAFVAFTVPANNDELRVEKYFKYLPSTSGQEDDETQWEEITSTEYTSSGCSSTYLGCRIKTEDFVFDNQLNRYIPQQVNVTTHLSGRKTPIVDAFTLEAKNKSALP